MTIRKYPIEWVKNSFSIKIFCSIPNVATGIIISTGKNFFVVDPGDGILRDLNNEIGIEKILAISDLFITHGHHDHVGGVWSLLTYMRVMNKKSPLNIYYPKGCIEIISIYNAFIKVYEGSLPYKIVLHEIDGDKKLSTKKVKVQPFPVIHKEYLTNRSGTRLVPALGFKFNFEGIKICYGGDTAYCDELVKMAKDSDLAIIEAGHDDNTSDDMHMTMKEAKSIGKSAKEFFLVHVPERHNF